MATHTEQKFTCDRCGKSLPTYNNTIAIVTSNRERSIGWSRLRVTIQHHHGSHNNGKTESADLCQKCAVFLLNDAAQRVEKGERLSAGVETERMLKFNEAF